MSIARVQAQPASWHLLSDTVRRRKYIGFSGVEPHVNSDLIEPGRPWSCQAQVGYKSPEFTEHLS